jgi:hypothetical protein
MQNRGEKKALFFHKMCKVEFEFLETEFNCKVVDISQTKSCELVIYTNETTAVQISLELRDGGIFVEIMKLVDGKIPPKEIFINSNTQLNRFDFEDFLAIRNPSLSIERPDLNKLIFEPGWEKIMTRIVRQFATELRKHASDVLKGDFRIFSNLEKIVKAR